MASDDDDDVENTATKVARGLNALSRATGAPYNKGAVGVQTNADMITAQKVSDRVPRKSAPLYNHPSSAKLRDTQN